MLSTTPPRHRGKETHIAHGDVVLIDRSSGSLSILRDGEKLQLNAYPFDPEKPTDLLTLESRLTVAQASTIAKLVGISSGLKVRNVEEDGGTSQFILFDPSVRDFSHASP